LLAGLWVLLLLEVLFVFELMALYSLALYSLALYSLKALYPLKALYSLKALFVPELKAVCRPIPVNRPRSRVLCLRKVLYSSKIL
jgi:hypothetical protein